MKYNEAAAELKKYDHKAVMDEKLSAIQADIKELNDKYEKDMKIY